MRLLPIKALAAGIALAGAFSTVSAQEITGAGATFPAPLYAKWADAYHKATGARINYQSVGPVPAFVRSAARPSTLARPMRL